MMPDQPEQREHEQAVGFPSEVVATPVVDGGSAAAADSCRRENVRQAHSSC